MIVYDSLPDGLSKGVALCIGKFDGFHLGHRSLIEAAKNTGMPVAVLTFVFAKTNTIDTPEEKRKIAEGLGVDHYIEIEAGPEFFALSPERFIKEVVKDTLHAKAVIVGEDFKFGHDRVGDISTLQEMSSEYDYEFKAMPKLKNKGMDISSSRIRDLITKGQVSEAADLLGRYYKMSGTISGGNKIGRTMGVPTANIIPPEGKVAPPHGVYAVKATIGDGRKTIYGIANFGVKPTIGKNPVGLEVHLFDVNDDIYDESLEVEFVSFIRAERQFDSIESLHIQIEEDIVEAKRRLKV